MVTLEEPQHLAVTIRTRTPVWFGDIDGMGDRGVQLPGLMGSLRWWWEALTRGVSAHVPNIFPPREVKEPDAAQRIFGATGHRRLFRIVTLRDGLKPSNIRRRVDIPGCRRSWYFQSNALQGDLEVDIIALRNDFQPLLIFELLHFISKFGAIGARPQMGFGIVSAKPSGGLKIPRSLIADRLHKDRFSGNPSEEIWDGGMPALHNMFFAEVEPRDPNGVSDDTTFLIKKQIRDAFRGAGSTPELRHFVSGHLHGQQRVGSKVMVSRPFGETPKGKRIRLYGWYPRNVPAEAAMGVGADSETLASQREYALQRVFDCLQGEHAITYWREMGAPRRDKTESKGGPIIFYLQLAGFVK